MNMVDPFRTNPHKAAAKIRINNTLIGVCLTIFGVLWAFSPEKLGLEIMLQFIFAVPLLYVSSLCYTKIAYWEEVKLWDYFGWFTGTTALAFVFNVIGILSFLIGFRVLALIYFFTIWLLLAIYTAINYYYKPKNVSIKIFKLLYFIAIQLIFGVAILYL